MVLKNVKIKIESQKDLDFLAEYCEKHDKRKIFTKNWHEESLNSKKVAYIEFRQQGGDYPLTYDKFRKCPYKEITIQELRHDKTISIWF